MTFTIYGKPQRQQRPRFGRGRVYAPSRSAQDALGTEIMLKMRESHAKPLEGPVSLYLSFFGAGKSDLTNLVKLFEDAANKVLWNDDRQVLHLEAWKHTCNPGQARTEVVITALEEV